MPFPVEKWNYTLKYPSESPMPDTDTHQLDFWADATAQSPVPIPPDKNHHPAVFEDEADRIAERLQALTHSEFRMSWHLKARQIQYIHEKGIEIIAKHADELIATRLAPAFIPNDGSQTPMKGHPVFIAQHATGTCCRNCLKKWHHIESGTAFTSAQQHYVTTLIMTWIHRQLSRLQTIPAPATAVAGETIQKHPRRKKRRLPPPEPNPDLFG